MTHTTIDFGFGWDPSADFDIPHVESQTAQEIPQQLFTQLQDKAAYLEMQQAVQNKDVHRLKALLAVHKGYLTASRWETLGRAAIKNYSADVMAILDQCNWDKILTEDLALWCVTHDQEQAFDFAKNVFARADQNNKISSQIKNLYALLMQVTPHNYVLFDKYRSKIATDLTGTHKHEMAVQLCAVLHAITPKTFITFQNLFKELSDENWQEVFDVRSPFDRWRESRHAFGLTLLLKCHPHIAPQLEKSRKTHALKEKRLQLIALNTVFKIGLHDPITSQMRAKDIFKPEFIQHVEKTANAQSFLGLPRDVMINSPQSKKEVLSPTPYKLFGMYTFKKHFEAFCKAKHIPWCEKRYSGVERLIQYDSEFILKLSSSVEGQSVLRKLLEKSENASTVAEHIVKMDKKQWVNIWLHIAHVKDSSGCPFLHHVAKYIVSIANGSSADIAMDLISSPLIDWDEPTDGFSAKDIVLSNVPYDLQQKYTDTFQLREMLVLKNTVQTARKDSGLKNKSQTKRKM